MQICPIIKKLDKMKHDNDGFCTQLRVQNKKNAFTPLDTWKMKVLENAIPLW